jgi:hypothetical protein
MRKPSLAGLQGTILAFACEVAKAGPVDVIAKAANESAIKILLIFISYL